MQAQQQSLFVLFLFRLLLAEHINDKNRVLTVIEASEARQPVDITVK